jgi:hypothetical protein
MMIPPCLLALTSILTIAASIPFSPSGDYGHNEETESRLLHQFNSWNENLAVYGESSLLITQIVTPNLYLLPITNSSAPTLIHTFNPFGGILGITEVHYNKFYVVAGNFSLSPPDVGIGTYTIWSVDMTGYSSTPTSVSIKQTASFAHGGLINGLSTLSVSRGLIIAADSTFGIIWLVNIHTGAVSILLQEPEMAPPANATIGIGINGLHILPRLKTPDIVDIYFDNTDTMNFYRVPISLSTLKKTGPVENIKSAVTIDDFALDGEKGVAYLASGSSNAVFRLGLEDGSLETVVGGLNSTIVPGPTSVVLGKGKEKGNIFVTTDDGKVVQVELSG